MVNIINNSDQTDLSEEELFELSKISSEKIYLLRDSPSRILFLGALGPFFICMRL